MTLTSLRYEKGLTQEQLANFFGVSRQTIATAEKNGLSHCSRQLVDAICEFFGVRPCDLLSAKEMLRYEIKSKDEAKVLIAKIKEEFGL